MGSSSNRGIRVIAYLLLSAGLWSGLGCNRVHVPPYSEAEELKFRADERKDLSGPRGDLAQLRNQVIEGTTSVGNGPERVKLEHWPGQPMELAVNGKDIVVTKVSGDALLDGRPMTDGEVIPPAEKGQQHWITNGPISIRMTKHKQERWLQVLDAKSEPLQTLHALNFYPPSPRYRVAAEWVPLAGGYGLTYHRTNGGSDLAETAPGYVEFLLDGKRYRLYATLEEGMLYIVFRDQTSKTETYPSARFLEILFDSRAFDPSHPFDPSKRTKMALDFNQAVNPACAYNPNTHCPIAPPENRLPIAIPAGEKRYHPVD
ncbi:DUF1684 domain-containing protein [Terriglobus roseus]|uniref:DUF1684 domain-containing protein n=1 Tax=Terriglobus roseus TaxID=392734 RepID=A0A1H4MW25_9BACT|nr:DUF1684 domain-containing protein [Terriglobus roseus]SEB86878.1 hypothetical protein SAMN05443244_2050 [Terriglobus roseus]